MLRRVSVVVNATRGRGDRRFSLSGIIGGLFSFVDWQIRSLKHKALDLIE